MSEDFKLLSDTEIATQIRAGMVPQATLRVQARQMKALDRIANSLEVIVTLLAHPAQPTKVFPPIDTAEVEAAEARAFGHKTVTLPARHTPPGPIHYEPPADPGAGEPGTTISIDPEEPGAHVGPATEIADAGTPRARRRRGAVG